MFEQRGLVNKTIILTCIFRDYVIFLCDKNHWMIKWRSKIEKIARKKNSILRYNFNGILIVFLKCVLLQFFNNNGIQPSHSVLNTYFFSDITGDLFILKTKRVGQEESQTKTRLTKAGFMTKEDNFFGLCFCIVLISFFFFSFKLIGFVVLKEFFEKTF